MVRWSSARFSRLHMGENVVSSINNVENLISTCKTKQKKKKKLNPYHTQKSTQNGLKT